MMFGKSFYLQQNIFKPASVVGLDGILIRAVAKPGAVIANARNTTITNYTEDN